MQRGKQKRTMADMRALATAIESYHVDNNFCPTAACTRGLYTAPGTALDDSSFTQPDADLHRTRSRCATAGGGSSPTTSTTGFSIYNIRSLGRDGASSTLVCGTTTDFNDDIVYSNGTFVQWPEGAQQ